MKSKRQKSAESLFRLQYDFSLNDTMKSMIAGILISMLSGICSSAANDTFYELIDAKGRPLQAKLLRFDASAGRIHIETVDGRRAWIDPSDLSGRSRDDVECWIETERFLSDEHLSISVNLEFKGAKVYYELIMENRTDSPMPSLKIDYIIYVKRKHFDEDNDEMRYITGTLMKDSLRARGKVILTTEAATLEKETKTATRRNPDTNGKWTVITKVSEDQPMGVWFRMYGPPLNDVPSMRDVSFPKSLKEDVDWEEDMLVKKNDGVDLDSSRDVTSPTVSELNSMLPQIE